MQTYIVTKLVKIFLDKLRSLTKRQSYYHKIKDKKCKAPNLMSFYKRNIVTQQSKPESYISQNGYTKIFDLSLPLNRLQSHTTKLNAMTDSSCFHGKGLVNINR